MKGRTIKGDSSTVIKCATKCSYSDQNIVIPQPKQQYNQFLHPTILVRAAVPSITDRWAPRGTYTQLPGLQRSGSLLQQLSSTENRKQKTDQSPILSSPLLLLQAPKHSFDSHHQKLREKAAKLDWRVDPLIPKV
jgi:hypothetical protein